MERKIVAFAIIIISLILPSYVFAQETLTNETIVTLVKAGLGEELIISKIKTSQNQFDVSTDGILKLKKEGVNEKIMKAMIEASGRRATTPSTPPAKDLTFQQRWVASMDLEKIYLRKDEKMMSISPIKAEHESSKKKKVLRDIFGGPSSTYGPEDIWHFVRGEKSAVRANDKKPIFYTKINPSAFSLVNLTYDAGKDIRFAVSYRGVYKRTIPMNFQGNSETCFEIILKEDLSLGEYAFITSRGFFYDFGVGE